MLELITPDLYVPYCGPDKEWLPRKRNKRAETLQSQFSFESTETLSVWKKGSHDNILKREPQKQTPAQHITGPLDMGGNSANPRVWLKQSHTQQQGRNPTAKVAKSSSTQQPGSNKPAAKVMESSHGGKSHLMHVTTRVCFGCNTSKYPSAVRNPYSPIRRN